MMADTKSRELTLYNDGGYKLQVRPIDGSTDAGPGFSIKTTLLNGQGDWGLYVPMLKVDTMYGVRGVGSMIGMHEYKIVSLESGLQSEGVRAVAAEGKLQQSIDSEAAIRLAADSYHTSQIAQEISDRQSGDFQLTNSLSFEVTRAQAAEQVLTGSVTSVTSGLATEIKERKDEVVRLDARILQEIQTRGDSVFNEAQLRETADIKLGARCDGLVLSQATESSERKSEVKRLDGRLDFITSNVDASAIDSLTEIVSQFSQNGVGYATRLSWLEAVVADLVNKSQ